MGNINVSRNLTEAYLEPCQTSQMELMTKLVNGFQPLEVKRSTSSKVFVNMLNKI